MEERIIKIFIKMLCENNLDDMYVNKKGINELKSPMEISNKDFENLPFNVLSDFNSNYFKEFKNILFENALIYALDNNDNEYIKYVNKNKENIEELLNNDFIFRIKTTNNAVKNIINKLYNKINNDDNIKKMYPKYFDLLNKYNVITDLCRDVVLRMLSVAKDNEEMLVTLDLLLYTNNLDFVAEEIKDVCDMNTFKHILKRIIIADVYLYLQNIDYNNEDDYDEFESDVEEILEYIENGIDNDSIRLPSNNVLRAKIFMNFIIYNLDIYNKYYDLENLSKDNAKKLIKINPFVYLEKDKKQ